jgi:hypothetical protein
MPPAAAVATWDKDFWTPPPEELLREVQRFAAEPALLITGGVPDDFVDSMTGWMDEVGEEPADGADFWLFQDIIAIDYVLQARNAEIPAEFFPGLLEHCFEFGDFLDRELDYGEPAAENDLHALWNELIIAYDADSTSRNLRLSTKVRATGDRVLRAAKELERRRPWG